MKQYFSQLQVQSSWTLSLIRPWLLPLDITNLNLIISKYFCLIKTELLSGSLHEISLARAGVHIYLATLFRWRFISSSKKWNSVHCGTQCEGLLPLQGDALTSTYSAGCRRCAQLQSTSSDPLCIALSSLLPFSCFVYVASCCWIFKDIKCMQGPDN